MNDLRADVLVVGAGLAGAAAALEAAQVGADVLLVGGAAGSSPRAQGGIAAARSAGDSPELHAADTLAAGSGLCDPAAVSSITDAAPAAIEWLAGLGVEFASEPGREAAHSRARVWHAGGDRSGAGIMRAVGRALAAQPRIRRERDRLAALGIGGARFAGCSVAAGATVLATGGYAGLHERTTNARISDGQGLTAALEIGATAADLEFVQFHPTVFAGPGRPFLVTEALRGAGARLLDARGRRFVDELATRAEVAAAIGAIGGCRLDARSVRGLAVHFPAFVRNCRAAGLDPALDPIPIAPAAHYTMGGIVTDLEGWTGVPGLLAAGECAHTGLHGANRLASNSLLEAVVMGRRAGRRAAQAPAPPTWLGAPPPDPRGDLTVAEVRGILSRAAGITRTQDGLLNGLEELGGRAPASLAAARCARLAHLILEGALSREESAGAHIRTDSALARASSSQPRQKHANGGA